VGHHHGHGSALSVGNRGRLRWVLFITAGVFTVEAVGAVLTGSLTLWADAGHLLTDVVGLGAALAASRLADRAPTARWTFGWQRAEILAAAINGLLLLGTAILVGVSALQRVLAPTDVGAAGMLTVALLGLVGSGTGVALLHRGQRGNINLRGAYLEVLGDLWGSAAAAVAAGVILIAGAVVADPIASLIIVALIVPRALNLLRQAGHVLLEGAPAEVDLSHVRAHMTSVPGVLEVHDLHVWTITSGRHVVSAHVVVDDNARGAGCGGSVLDRLGECLSEHFDVGHSTFQLEPASHRHHEFDVH
jgi:cobalt-zinc-cadmium efflux system protein